MRISFPGNQVVALDLDVNIRQSGIPRQPEEFPADEGIKTGCTERRYNSFNVLCTAGFSG